MFRSALLTEAVSEGSFSDNPEWGETTKPRVRANSSKPWDHCPKMSAHPNGVPSFDIPNLVSSFFRTNSVGVSFINDKTPLGYAIDPVP